MYRHRVDFRLHDGSSVTIEFEADMDFKLRNWWLMEDENGNPRRVASCLHLSAEVADEQP